MRPSPSFFTIFSKDGWDHTAARCRAPDPVY